VQAHVLDVAAGRQHLVEGEDELEGLGAQSLCPGLQGLRQDLSSTQTTVD
jgi:hypothetical protein